MTSDAPEFRPFRPRRLVSAGGQVELGGPGTRFTVGELVVEEPAARPSVLQLAARKR